MVTLVYRNALHGSQLLKNINMRKRRPDRVFWGSIQIGPRLRVSEARICVNRAFRLSHGLKIWQEDEGILEGALERKKKLRIT